MPSSNEYMQNYMSQYWKDNPDKYEAHKKTVREYSKTHPKSKEKNSKNVSSCRQKIRTEILNRLGHKCANPFNFPHPDWCNDEHCLQIDHINGGGMQEMRKFKSDYSYMRFILNQIKAGSKDYQLLCANCNWIKRFINNELDSNR